MQPSFTQTQTPFTHVSLEQDSQSNDWDSSLDEINATLPAVKSSTPSVERGVNWLENETMLLLDGKKRLDDDMQTGTLLKSMKSRTQRWDFVSSYLADMGVVKTSQQCEYRWSRLCKPFKTIYDYEKCIPSGQDSYWNLANSDRTSKKLPRTFDKKIYVSMREKFAGDRAIDPGDILIDSSSPTLHSNHYMPSICIFFPPSMLYFTNCSYMHYFCRFSYTCIIRRRSTCHLMYHAAK